ncbi:hypothetical protein DSM3645_02938 [Blastopirellula marina DSM 3645]|uniref:Uncharacterized protein n=1 Tax=Blastopirellula marina DSM 3645 TaxID=314230 RepID=A3ZVQ1_9BACT|nr:hypothetical protein DSM3645_02938 [Blastopirellula marina DSM 3645]
MSVANQNLAPVFEISGIVGVMLVAEFVLPRLLVTVAYVPVGNRHVIRRIQRNMHF